MQSLATLWGSTEPYGVWFDFNTFHIGENGTPLFNLISYMFGIG
jgi:hypothetical protein